MPYKGFIGDSIKDEKSLAQQFKEYIKYIYDGNCNVESESENEARLSMNVPGDLKREDFESDVQEWCDEHNCSYELINQAPEAPSPQFFSENMKLMYPRIKTWEKLKSDERKLNIAKTLWKKNWVNVPFDENNPDDQEDMVLLYNEYMEELSEWKPVELKLIFKKELTEDSRMYRIKGILVNPNDPSDIKESKIYDGQNDPVGTYKEIKEMIPGLEETFNTGRNDGYVWRLKPSRYI